MSEDSKPGGDAFVAFQILWRPPCPHEQSPLILGDGALETGAIASMFGGHCVSQSVFICALSSL